MDIVSIHLQVYLTVLFTSLITVFFVSARLQQNPKDQRPCLLDSVWKMPSYPIIIVVIHTHTQRPKIYNNNPSFFFLVILLLFYYTTAKGGGGLPLSADCTYLPNLNVTSREHLHQEPK